jgi:hypothetical protein
MMTVRRRPTAPTAMTMPEELKGATLLYRMRKMHTNEMKFAKNTMYMHACHYNILLNEQNTAKQETCRNVVLNITTIVLPLAI